MNDDRPKSSAFSDIGAVTDFPAGAGRRVELANRAIAVFHTDAGFAALEDRCPHAGAPLSRGVLRDGVIVCSWHGWCIEPATGRCPQVPWAREVVRYDVRIQNGRVLVACTPPDHG